MAHLTRSLAFIMFHTRIHRHSARPWPLSLHLPWLLGALAMGAGLAQGNPSPEPSLTCQVTYAGKTTPISVTPTSDPYGVASVSIDDRFFFKAVHVPAGQREPRIAIYVYREGPQQPILIQHVQLRPPYPKAEQGAADLLGEQHLHAGKLERELIYRCSLLPATP